jgi:hypothetical protein
MDLPMDKATTLQKIYAPGLSDPLSPELAASRLLLRINGLKA